jgi:DNA helicase-2/ATP-dependent DNA helicase PcrA
MTIRVETAADQAVRECLDERRSFALIAGAGSGKTSSLVDALERIREREGRRLRQNGQRVACITYTKRAVEVIKTRLGFDDIYFVSTLHSFLWEQVGRFQSDIREAVKLSRLPNLIAKELEKDNGGKSRDAIDARAKAEKYKQDLAAIDTVEHFEYRDAKSSNYQKGQLSHEDVIEIAGYLFRENATFRRITGLRYPYILVDEAQDTFDGLVAGLNLVCANEGLPIVGYFGDPWQQIYDARAGDFGPPPCGKTISKTENFRCSESVIRLLNAFRDDVKQYAAGENKGREGTVIFRLVGAEKPELPRNRYSDDQIVRALGKMDCALADWGWEGREDIIRLFLAQQMIARRMGFAELNRLFTGTYASARAEDAFDKGDHFLLRPLTTTVHPLISAHSVGDSRGIINILRRDSPAFAIDGPNAAKTLKSMIETSLALVEQLSALWTSGNTKEILQFCADKQLIPVSETLAEHLRREPRSETYDEALHSVEKGDWLADAFFVLDVNNIPAYSAFISKNTAFSTQHGVKGEEYPKVLVVYDDVEASWNNYNFGKVLAPATLGEPTEKQLARTRKLAYVSFSRALEDLRVLLFTPNPQGAKQELITRGLLKPEQIEIA